MQQPQRRSRARACAPCARTAASSDLAASMSARNAGSACSRATVPAPMYATLHYVAVPMDVAHVAALSVRHTARENRIGLLWRNLAQHERPRPANGRVSRRIRAVLRDSRLLAGGADGLFVRKKRTRRAGSDSWQRRSRAPTSVSVRRSSTYRCGVRFFRDRGVERAGECAGRVRKAQIGIQQSPASSAVRPAQSDALARDILVKSERGRACRWGCGKERQAVGKRFLSTNSPGA